MCRRLFLPLPKPEHLPFAPSPSLFSSAAEHLCAATMIRSLSRNLARRLKPYSPIRPHCSQSPDPQRQIALQMIQYALGYARSKRSAESYAEAIMLLEQGVGNLGRGEGWEGDGVGMLMLAMATLLHERGEIGEALYKLKKVRELSSRFSIDVQVAAYEGLVGLNLEEAEDVAASIAADEFRQLLQTRQEGGISVSNEVGFRCKSLRGLIDLVVGDLKAAELVFYGSEHREPTDLGDYSGNTVLSYGEFLHASGDLSLAKDFYERALQVSQAKVIPESSYLSAVNMVSEEALVGAACSLGQLLAHSGNFQDAEEMLTKALTSAEEHFGQNHPKVGIVLTCMSNMFGHKAKMEKSSSLLIQEGLYRKAIELLKAPSLDDEGTNLAVKRSDIVALARGGYAETLCVQQNRKTEGETMRMWAEANWRNRRLSLAEALEFTEPSKAAVIDTRISRVI